MLGKLGLDTHDRGIKLIATWLRDAGMEVIYLGPYLEAAAIAKVAAEEDADVVGVSFLDGGQVGWCEDLMHALRQQGLDDVHVVVGGTIPAADAEILRQLGVACVFTPGTPMEAVVSAIRSLCTGDY